MLICVFHNSILSCFHRKISISEIPIWENVGKFPILGNLNVQCFPFFFFFWENIGIFFPMLDLI